MIAHFLGTPACAIPTILPLANGLKRANDFTIVSKPRQSESDELATLKASSQHGTELWKSKAVFCMSKSNPPGNKLNYSSTPLYEIAFPHPPSYNVEGRGAFVLIVCFCSCFVSVARDVLPTLYCGAGGKSTDENCS